MTSGTKPAGLYGNSLEDQRLTTLKELERALGVLEGSQFEAVDDDFKDEKLGDEGNG